VSIYAALLWLYPASFRDQYGREMRAIFARRWRQAPGVIDRARLVMEALVDVLRNAPAAHGDILRLDVSTAAHTIWRARGVSLTIVAVTAVGIGATVAAFAVADHVLIRPLPFHDPGRLVKIWQIAPGGGRVEASPANFRDWREHATSFERIAAFEFSSRNLAGSGDPVRLEGASVTADLFATLGVAPLIGRALMTSDDLETAPPTLVISERLWRSRFAADLFIVGRTVVLEDKVHVIVGVMPATFQFPSRVVDFWIPLQLQPSQYNYGNPFLHTIARLRNGVSREQAHAEVQEIVRAVAGANPKVNARFGAAVATLREDVTRQGQLLLWILMAAAASVLLIACTNLANLLLVRGLAREREMAVRAALGAGRHRLMRQLFTENALLAACGGVAGIAIAVAGIPLLVRLVPTNLPVAEGPAIDGRLLTAAVAATFFSAIGFGLLPALRISRQSDARALRTGTRAGTSRWTTRLRSSLVVAQVSLSIVLLVASGLLLRAMVRVQNTYPGFRSEGVLTLRTALPVKKYESVSLRHQFFSRVLEGVEALPGVASAAYTTGLPMVDRARIWVINVPGYEGGPSEQRVASLRFITPRFFETLGVPLQSGRDISLRDTQASPPVAVVSESFARRYWPEQDAVGRQFRLRATDWTIVGVVGDIHVRGLEAVSEPQMYLAEQQMPDRGLSAYVPRDLIVRSELARERLLPAIREIIASADPQQPIADVRPLADVVSGETAPRRVQVRVLGAFAAIAFLLAGIGLHGLLAYDVTQRARDIGVRLALGADRRRILGMVLAHGLRLVTAGAIAGGALAALAGRSLEALLAGVSPLDLATYGAAVALVLVMTAIGSLLPALKATRVDPLQVIRAE
jgi:putative ABC transport system permease protein